METGGRTLQQVLRELQGSIFFQKTLRRTNAARNDLVSSASQLGIPRWFVERHSDKICEVVDLRVASGDVWSVRLYMILPKRATGTAALKLLGGWNEFATFHGLAESDKVIFLLTAVSEFQVFMFHRTGEAKASCFVSPEARCVKAHESSQRRLGYGESLRERKEEDSPFSRDSMRLFNPSRMSPPSFIKRLTFWNFDNPRGNSRRVRTDAVLEMPVMFFRAYGNRIRGRVQLQGVGEASPVRNVSCVSKGENGVVRLVLRAGWRDFAEDNMLRVGQKVVFSLTAESFFTVRVCSLRM